MSKSNKIKKITALEILDSRGIPTLNVQVDLEGGVKASAQVPSGTSSGANEAFELRDGDKNRYGGMGVLKAVSNVNKEIFSKLKGLDASDQKKIDQTLIDLDGTKNKSRLGANAILGVSTACARVSAIATGRPLYKYLREVFGLKLSGYKIPQAMFNLLNGGAHAESGMDVQEFMLVPRANSFSESLRMAVETFSALRRLLTLGQFATSVGLEGGFAPNLKNSKQAIEILIEATRQAGLPNQSVTIALDVAATGLYDKKSNRYVFGREQKKFTREQLLDWYTELASKHPITSIEDGLQEEDFEGWQMMNSKLSGKIRIVGDDFTVTNSARLKEAIEMKALNSVIIKPNQIGTISETMDTIRLAQENKISINISHRSGETNDPFIADLAVAVNAEFIKSGSVNRGERTAKYNRLLKIEKEISDTNKTS